MHQSSKRVSPQHPCIKSVPSCVVFDRVARTTLRGSWVHTLRKVKHPKKFKHVKTCENMKNVKKE